MKIDSRYNLANFVSLAVLITGCLNISVAQQTARPAAANTALVAQAEQLIASGRLDAGLEILTVAARTSPDDLNVRLLIGTAYYRKADHRRAVEHLTAVTVASPPQSTAHVRASDMLATSHYLLGNFKEAVPHLEATFARAPDNTEIAYALGVSYLLTQERDKARATFARMFNFAPNSAAACLLNAQMMIRQGLEEYAERELQRAAVLDPRLPQVNFMLGELAIYKSRIDEGIELLKKEIALNPAFAMSYYRLGEAYARQLQWDAAIPPLQKSIWLNPFFSGPYIVLGKVYSKQKQHDTAEAMLRRAVQMDPNNHQAHHLLAQVLRETNRADEALKELQIAERLRAAAGVIGSETGTIGK